MDPLVPHKKKTLDESALFHAKKVHYFAPKSVIFHQKA